jgi:hypothetical protein
LAGPLSTALGDTLIAIIDLVWPRVAPRLGQLMEDVGEALCPHPPMSIRTLDGHVLTGIVLVERGQVLAFLGTRQVAPAAYPWRPYDEDDGPQHR